MQKQLELFYNANGNVKWLKRKKPSENLEKLKFLEDLNMCFSFYPWVFTQEEKKKTLYIQRLVHEYSEQLHLQYPRRGNNPNVHQQVNR